MTSELVTMGVSGVLGFIMKIMAQNSQNQHEERMYRLKEATANNDSADRAAKRVPMDVGKQIRTIMVASCVFAVFFANFIMAIYGKPTFVQVTQMQPEVLGIIPASTRQAFVELDGFLFSEVSVHCMLALISFYFGSTVKPDK